jgi:iron complex transport system ATP-binding protein
MTNGILSIESLSYRYDPGQPIVVSDVSFSITPGTVTAILGPNGAGKSTLMNLLLGLQKPESGSIHLEDLPLHKYSRRELSQWMGLVPQSEYIPFEYSVLEFVLLGRAPYLGPLDLPGDKDVEIAMDAITQVGIPHLAHRPIPSLSGGELQLVLIARALAQQPRILLLDEPTSHLDLANRNAILRILGQLRVTGVTVIFTTHDPEAASLIADHLVLMRASQVVFTGDMESTFTTEKLTQTYGIPVEVIMFEGVRLVKSLERLS